METGKTVQPVRVASVDDDAIRERAYALWQRRGGGAEGALADWLDAERELVAEAVKGGGAPPAVELAAGRRDAAYGLVELDEPVGGALRYGLVELAGSAVQVRPRYGLVELDSPREGRSRRRYGLVELTNEK